MKLSEIVDILDASVLAGEQEQLNKDIHTTGASDLMSDILAGLSEGCVFLTGLTTVQVIRTAIISNVEAVVIVRGKRPPDEVIEMAKSEGVLLMSTPFSMFVACGRLYNKGMVGLDNSR